MKEIKRFLVVTKVLEVRMRVEDEWEEGDEVDASNIITSKVVEGSQMIVGAGRFFASDEAAELFQQDVCIAENREA